MKAFIHYFTIGLFAFGAFSCELDGDEEEELEAPQDKSHIADFHPKSIQAGDTLVITGDFPIDTAEISVTFWRYYPVPESDFDVEVLTTSPTKITALVHITCRTRAICGSGFISTTSIIPPTIRCILNQLLIDIFSSARVR